MGEKQEATSFEVTKNEHGQRLDLCLLAQNLGLSRSQIRKAVRDGLIRVNHRLVKAGYILSAGELVVVASFEIGPRAPRPQALPLDIVHEDKYLLVLNKAAGVSVHPSSAYSKTTLVDALLAHCDGSFDFSDMSNERLGVVHRLDKDTTGLMLWAKNDAIARQLMAQIKQRKVLRRYLALLDGVSADTDFELETYLYRDPKDRRRFASLSIGEYQSQESQQLLGGVRYRWSRSRFERIGQFGHFFSLMRVSLDTGRTHQIRVHAKHMGTPVLGDPLYGQKRDFPAVLGVETRRLLRQIESQLLHAAELSFEHPVTGAAMHFTCQPPAFFVQLLEDLSCYQGDEWDSAWLRGL